MKKRYKLLLLVFISFILTLIIYFIYKSDKRTYIALGSNFNQDFNLTFNYIDYIAYYKKDFIISNYTNNKELIETTLLKIGKNENKIKYSLKNAEIITLGISNYELNNYKEITNEIAVEYLNNIYKLLKELKSLNDNTWIINNLDSKYSFFINKIKQFSNNLNLKYVDTQVIEEKNRIYYENTDYINYHGHNKIAKYIIKDIK